MGKVLSSKLFCTWTGPVLNAVIYLIDADEVAISVDPDQTAPVEQSDQGLHCLVRLTCPDTSIKNI